MRISIRKFGPALLAGLCVVASSVSLAVLPASSGAAARSSVRGVPEPHVVATQHGVGGTSSAWARLVAHASAVERARKKHEREVLWWDTIVWNNALRAYVPSPYTDAQWWKIAIAETGGDVGMHGATYSSCFGVLNGHPGGQGGVWGEADNAASAERIVSGTANYAEELRMAKREANQYGIHAWAPSSVAKAGIA